MQVQSGMGQRMGTPGRRGEVEKFEEAVVVVEDSDVVVVVVVVKEEEPFLPLLLTAAALPVPVLWPRLLLSLLLDPLRAFPTPILLPLPLPLPFCCWCCCWLYRRSFRMVDFSDVLCLFWGGADTPSSRGGTRDTVAARRGEGVTGYSCCRIDDPGAEDEADGFSRGDLISAVDVGRVRFIEGSRFAGMHARSELVALYR